MKILFVQGEVFGANVSEPVMRALEAGGDQAIAFTTKAMMAYRAWLNRGVQVKTPEDYGFSDLGSAEMREVILAEKPDVVVVGVCEVAAEDGEPAKLAINAGCACARPVVLLVGAWPHLWLQKYGVRDLSLYRRVSKILAFDDISRQEFLRNGFSADQITITGNPDNDSIGHLKDRAKEVRLQLRRRFGIKDSELLSTYAVSGNNPSLLVAEDHPHYLGFQEMEALKDFLALTKQAGFRAVIRVKPGFDRSYIQSALEERSVAALVLGEEYKSSREVVLASDVVIGTTTQVLQEANFLGVLPISYLPNISRPNPQIANQLGVVHTISAKASLEALLLNFRSVDLRPAINWVEVDSNSTERVVASITGS